MTIYKNISIRTTKIRKNRFGRCPLTDTFNQDWHGQSFHSEVFL